MLRVNTQSLQSTLPNTLQKIRETRLEFQGMQNRASGVIPSPVEVKVENRESCQTNVSRSPDHRSVRVRQCSGKITRERAHIVHVVI